jgi:uncharacterized protein YjdB
MKKLYAMSLMLTLLFLLVPSQSVQAAVKISKKNATMEVDSTLKLKVGGTKSKVTWKSSNKSIVTINTDGIVTAIAEGEATISATVNKNQYSCVINVVDSGKKEVTAKKGTVTELTTGKYLVGEDFPAGKYNVKTISGSGNFFVHGNETYVNEVMAEEGDETFDTHSYNNLKIYYGDEIEIRNGVILEFTKLD